MHSPLQQLEELESFGANSCNPPRQLGSSVHARIDIAESWGTQAMKVQRHVPIWYVSEHRRTFVSAVCILCVDVFLCWCLCLCMLFPSLLRLGSTAIYQEQQGALPLNSWKVSLSVIPAPLHCKVLPEALLVAFPL